MGRPGSPCHERRGGRRRRRDRRLRAAPALRRGPPRLRGDLRGPRPRSPRLPTSRTLPGPQGRRGGLAPHRGDGRHAHPTPVLVAVPGQAILRWVERVRPTPTARPNRETPVVTSTAGHAGRLVHRGCLSALPQGLQRPNGRSSARIFSQSVPRKVLEQLPELRNHCHELC
ncbi:MAG: hypothetical protein JWM17_1394 [Actinobacteria bacterium]|nr:hypothetical protein [Actinomycetota bacterium]